MHTQRNAVKKGLADSLPVCVTFDAERRDAEPAEHLRFTMLGSLEKQGDGFSLKYTETSPDALFGVDTHIECRGDQVLFRHAPPLNSLIVFQKNKYFISQYDTPQGKVSAQIFTDHAAYEQMARNGSISLNFRISSNGREASYAMRISFDAPPESSDDDERARGAAAPCSEASSAEPPSETNRSASC